MKKLIFIVLLLGMFGCDSKIPHEEKALDNHQTVTIYHYKNFDEHLFGSGDSQIDFSVLDKYITDNNINPDDILSIVEDNSRNSVYFYIITKKQKPL